jgi:hypothetical protein
MSVNQEKRLKKFDKEFSFYTSHPSYNAIKILYANGEIKTIASATAQFNKIKLTKTGTINKQSTNQVNKFETKKQELTGAHKPSIIKLTWDDVNPSNSPHYDAWIHVKEINKIMKYRPNDYFLHSVKFYENNKLSDNYETINIEFNKLNKKQVDKKLQYFVLDGSNVGWIVREYLDEKDKKGNRFNRYVMIETFAFKKQQDFDKQKRLIQIYKSNDNGTCVYDGFCQYFENKNDLTGKSIYNKLIKQADKYKKAYTKEEICQIAQLCKSTVVIRDLINGDDEIINESNTNYYRIEFVNSKYNHLDLYTCTSNNAESLTKNEYNEIKKSSKFYIEKGSKLHTLDNIYKVADSDFKIIFNNWKAKNNFSKLSICSDSLAYQYLDSYDFNMHRFVNNFEVKDNLYNEIDLKKAYYNYSNKEINSHYIGVPSGSFYCVKAKNFTIKDFNKTIKNNLIGFFTVKFIKTTDKLAFYGFSIGSTHTLTTSMIKFLSSFCEFEFIQMMYAPSVDIPFTEDFLTVGEDKIKYYCKAYGQFMCDTSTYSIEIKPLDNDIEFYQTLKEETSKEEIEDRGICECDGIFKIYAENKTFNTWRHIAYYIHSYTTLLVLEQLLKYNTSDVFGVKLDSIVLKKNVPLQLTNAFNVKETKIEKLLKNVDTTGLNDNLNEGIQIEMYKDGLYNKYKMEKEITIEFDYSFCPNGEILTNRLVFLGGAGGSGKTYGLLSSSNFYNKGICFTSTCWNLIQEQKKNFSNIIGLSFPKITGNMNGVQVDKYTGSNIRQMFIDEATLAKEEDIKQIMKDFYFGFVIVAGDVDEDGTYYQCSCLNKVIKPKKYRFQYIKYSKTYRFDENLNNKLMGLRQLMKDENKTNIELLKYVGKNFKSCFRKKEDITFDDNDIGISALRNKNDNNECLISNYFINKGAKPQYLINNTVLEKNQLKGQIFYEKPNHKNYRVSLFRTIHSFQGCQLNHENKIIIYLDSIFDRNLLYTALSRARRQDQIIIYTK